MIKDRQNVIKEPLIRDEIILPPLHIAQVGDCEAICEDFRSTRNIFWILIWLRKFSGISTKKWKARILDEPQNETAY